MPQSQMMPPTRVMTETTPKATFMFDRVAMAPMIQGEMASPNAWMMKMLMAKALARMAGWVTLAKMVFVGPVLKNRPPNFERKKRN